MKSNSKCFNRKWFITIVFTFVVLLLILLKCFQNDLLNNNQSKFCQIKIENKKLINSKLDTILLKKVLMKNKNTLIFRIPENSCNSCVTRETLVVKKYLNKNVNLNCLIITGYSSIRDYYVYIKNTNVKGAEIFNCKSFINQLDDSHVPYYLIIDDKFKIKKMMIVDKQNVKKSAEFIKYSYKISKE